MTAQNVLLQLVQLVCTHSDIGQLTKTSIDTVDGFSRSHHFHEEVVGTFHIGARRIREDNAFDSIERLEIGPTLGARFKTVVHGSHEFTRRSGYLAAPNPNTGTCDSF